MSLLLKAGIRRLSELEIDTDKDWRGRGISNIREVIAGMAIGDIIQHDGVKLIRLSPSVAHYVLTSQGGGHLVAWAPGGTYYERYFPVPVGADHDEVIVVPDHVRNLLAPVASPCTETIVPTKSPSIATLLAGAVVTPDHSVANTIAPATAISWVRMDAVGGAVADDGGVQTDEIAAANDPTVNDMHLLPVLPAIDDAYYFGYTSTFGEAKLNQSTKGVGDWTITWEYWNGSAWVALSGVNDETDGFKPESTGRRSISLTIPGDWAQCDVGGVGTMYWIRGRVSAFTSITTRPLGAQAWIVTTTSP